MNPKTRRVQIAGPAGPLECAIDEPPDRVRAVAVICHPHPLYGGTLDNKVVQTVARACMQLGMRSVRFNFRGVAPSGGAWDEGRGEVDDALAVIAAFRDPSLPLLVAGFSFGGYVAASASARLAGVERPRRLMLIAPATQNFSTPAVPHDTLVVHGELDDVVPLQATLDWARPQSLPVVVVPGVGHFFHGQLPLLKDIVVRAWLGTPIEPPLEQ
jgi:alpha/beta superfamily hydrolase